MKTRSTKRALLSSALALLLCFAMLVGTTFAWFTDSVTSENNIIKSGNLDVTFDYWNGSEWVTVAGASDILSADLFEPGYTEVAYFRVSNVGSLALKYQLGVNIVSETAGTNVAGEEFKLSDYIYFDVVEGQEPVFADRAAAMAYATETTLISNGFYSASALEAGADPAYLAMVVYMPETVGNEANHNGEDVPEINLGINIIATQAEAEEDSFGSDYDAAAWSYWDGTSVDYDWYTGEEEMTLTSAADFAAFAALVNGTAVPATTYAARETEAMVDSFAGVTITLATDIDLNGLNWTPIGNWDNAFEGTFDGNGHTIKNLYINDKELDGAGLFGVAQNATIKNVTVENVNVAGYEMVAAIVGSPYSGCEISNCHVAGDIKITAEYAYAGGIMAYGYSSVADCSVIANGTGTITAKERNAVGGISAWMLEGDNSIKNCTVKNLNLTGWANIGAISGFIHYSNEISGCTAENLVLTKTRDAGHPTIGLAAGGFSYNANKASTIKNNTFKNITLNATHVAAPASADILWGAEYGGGASTNFVTENNVTENVVSNLLKVVNSNASLKAELESGAEAVYVIAGTYTFPASSFQAGTTLYCAEGVVFEGTSSLNIAGATVVGATFSNVGGQAVSGTIYGTFKNCTFEGAETTRWCYTTAGTTVTFEDCVFNTTLRAFHFDEMNGDVVFKNCVINGGFNAYSGAGTMTFDGCDFVTSASNGYNGLNIYTTTNLINCTFVFDSAKTNFIDMEGTGKTLTITNCTATLDGEAIDLITMVGGSKLAQNEVVVDGAVVVSDVASLTAALKAGKTVILAADLDVVGAVIAMPNGETNEAYGNPVGFVQYGGSFDGNGNAIVANDTRTYMLVTYGGTIKNVTIDECFRGILLYSPTEDVIIDNVVISGDVCYAINTLEHPTVDGIDMIVTNSTLGGWSSFAGIESAYFGNCKFEQGTYYTNVYGRLVKPYVTTVFEDCDFSSQYYIDLSALEDGATVTFKNCTVNGVKLTAENYMDLIVAEDVCGEGQITIESKTGTYNAADWMEYVVIA